MRNILTGFEHVESSTPRRKQIHFQTKNSGVTKFGKKSRFSKLINFYKSTSCTNSYLYSCSYSHSYPHSDHNQTRTHISAHARNHNHTYIHMFVLKFIFILIFSVRIILKLTFTIIFIFTRTLIPT